MKNEKSLLESIKSYGNWCAMKREALNTWVDYKGNDLEENKRLKSIFDMHEEISLEHYEAIAERLNAVKGLL